MTETALVSSPPVRQVIRVGLNHMVLVLCLCERSHHISVDDRPKAIDVHVLQQLFGVLHRTGDIRQVFRDILYKRGLYYNQLVILVGVDMMCRLIVKTYLW